MLRVIKYTYKTSKNFITCTPYKGIQNKHARKQHYKHVDIAWNNLRSQALKDKLSEGDVIRMPSPYASCHIHEHLGYAGLLWRRLVFSMNGNCLLGLAEIHIYMLKRMGWDVDIPPPTHEEISYSNNFISPENELRFIQVTVKKCSPVKFPEKMPVYR